MRKRIIPNAKNLLKAIRVVGRAHNAPYRNYMADYGKVTIAGADGLLMDNIRTIVSAFCTNDADIIKVIRGHLTIFVEEGNFRDKVDGTLLLLGLPYNSKVYWEEEIY